jgi:cytidine deaminase
VEFAWSSLRQAAMEVAGRAHAPYSRLYVGAAGQTSDGRVLVGCNVENASFGLTLCAECGLVSSLHSTGGGRFEAVSVVTRDGRQLLPCGRCRQLLMEAGGVDLLVDTPAGPATLASLLPSSFGEADLVAGREADLVAGREADLVAPDEGRLVAAREADLEGRRDDTS